MSKQRNGKGRNQSNRKGFDKGKKFDGDKTGSETKFVKGEPNSKEPTPTSNDPSWYTTSPQLTEDTASISFNTPAGYALPHGVDRVDNGFSITVPGIATIQCLHGPGPSRNVESAVNIAARTLYSFVRHVNSGASNYDPNNLQMYLLAADEAYAWLSTLIRLYGTAMYYNSRNRYVPKFLTQALGFDSDVIKDLPRLRTAINMFIRGLGSLCVPADITIFQRHMFLYGNIFMDGDNDKAQLYAVVPYTIRRYNDTAVPAILEADDRIGPELYRQGTGSTRLNINQIESICDDILNDLLGSEEIGIMSGDILKAYGEGGLHTLSMLQPDFEVAPLRDDEFEHQIMNATLWAEFSNYDITTNDDLDEGYVKYWPTVHVSAPVHKDSEDYDDQAMFTIRTVSLNKILNVYGTEHPDASRVTYMTRCASLANAYGPLTKTSNMIELTLNAFGSELFGTMTVFRTTVDNHGNINGVRSIGIRTVNIDYGTDVNNLERISCLSSFNYHPTVYVMEFKQAPTATSSGIPHDFAVIQQFENYTSIATDVLDRIHDATILSMWNVPQLGLYRG
jgi:hypothetical protein